MEIEVCESKEDAAAQGAKLIAEHVAAAIVQRGHACIAVSGGHTPWAMLTLLAKRNLRWDKLTVFQVDERECPLESDDRNYKHLKEVLPVKCHIEAMPVEDFEGGSTAYAGRLQAQAGQPAVLDVVHLGLGPDGHTASLVPNDPVLDITDRDVAWTEPYQGHRRMTLTYPIINHARLVFWLVDGDAKREALARLMAGDTEIPAGRIHARRQFVIADTTAAANLKK
ncbi:MAG: 6-phosphogluconolactonase [Gammaproteobacteria bacterium]